MKRRQMKEREEERSEGRRQEWLWNYRGKDRRKGVRKKNEDRVKEDVKVFGSSRIQENVRNKNKEAQERMKTRIGLEFQRER